MKLTPKTSVLTMVLLILALAFAATHFVPEVSEGTISPPQAGIAAPRQVTRAPGTEAGRVRNRL